VQYGRVGYPFSAFGGQFNRVGGPFGRVDEQFSSYVHQFRTFGEYFDVRQLFFIVRQGQNKRRQPFFEIGGSHFCKGADIRVHFHKIGACR